MSSDAKVKADTSELRHHIPEKKITKNLLFLIGEQCDISTRAVCSRLCTMCRSAFQRLLLQHVVIRSLLQLEAFAGFVWKAMNTTDGREALSSVKSFTYKAPITCTSEDDLRPGSILYCLSRIPLRDASGRLLFPRLRNASLILDDPSSRSQGDFSSIPPMTYEEGWMNGKTAPIPNCFLTDVKLLKISSLPWHIFADLAPIFGMLKMNKLQMVHVNFSPNLPVSTIVGWLLRHQPCLKSISFNFAEDFADFINTPTYGDRNEKLKEYARILHFPVRSMWRHRANWEIPITVTIMLDHESQFELKGIWREYAIRASASPGEIEWLKEKVKWKVDRRRASPQAASQA